MRYRIKIETKTDNTKRYYAQKKDWIGWVGLDINGDLARYDCLCNDREEALRRIETNFSRITIGTRYEEINKIYYPKILKKL